MLTKFKERNYNEMWLSIAQQNVQARSREDCLNPNKCRVYCTIYAPKHSIYVGW